MVAFHAQCCLGLGIVVERDVVHAEFRLQALEGAVRRVHGATAAVATFSHGVSDRRIHSGRTSRQLIGLVVEVLVRAHVLINFVERDLDDWVLKDRHTFMDIVGEGLSSDGFEVN